MHAPELVLPDWLPPAVAKQATLIYPIVTPEAQRLAKRAGFDSTLAANVVSRVASHPEMRVVWQELYKKNQNPEPDESEFKNPAKKPGFLRVNLDGKILPQEHSDQDAAAIAVFRHMIAFMTEPPLLRTQAEAEKDVSDLMDLSKRLRIGAELLARYQIWGTAPGISGAAELRLIAESCDTYHLSAEGPERHAKDDQLRNFIYRTATILQLYYGNNLYGTLARLARVALSQTDITDEKIRNIIRKRDRTSGPNDDQTSA